MFDVAPDPVPATALPAGFPAARPGPLARSATDVLVGTEANPVPDGAASRIVQTSDAVALRAAAFPAVHVHHRHGTSIHRYALIDRLEVSDADPGTAWAWEASGWIGGDVQRFWWRTEGHAIDGSVDGASLEALYGRGVRAWWDVIAGVRHETGEGPDRTWVAFGVQGLAPGKFEVSATAYAGQGGRTALRGEAEYDTLLSNRVILQWRAEAEAHGKDDPQLRIGSGLSTVAAERTLIEMDVSRKKRAERIDSAAASFILQGALDRLSALARS